MHLLLPLLLPTAHAAVNLGGNDGDALVTPSGATWMATPSQVANNCGCDKVQYGTCYPRASSTHVADPVPHKSQCRADQTYLPRNRASSTTKGSCTDKNVDAGMTGTLTYYGMCYGNQKAYGALWADDCEDSEAFFSVPEMHATAGAPGHGDLSAYAAKYDCSMTQMGWCYNTQTHAMTAAVDQSWCGDNAQYVKPRSSMAGTSVTVDATADTFTHNYKHYMSVGDRFKIKATTMPTVGGTALNGHTGLNEDTEWYVVQAVVDDYKYKIAAAAASTTMLDIDGAGTVVKIIKPYYLCQKAANTMASKNLVPETMGNCYAMASPALGAHKLFCGLSDYFCQVDLDYTPTPSPTPAPTDGFLEEHGAWLWPVVGVTAAGGFAIALRFAYKAGKLDGLMSWKMFGSSLDVTKSGTEKSTTKTSSVSSSKRSSRV